MGQETISQLMDRVDACHIWIQQRQTHLHSEVETKVFACGDKSVCMWRQTHHIYTRRELVYLQKLMCLSYTINREIFVLKYFVINIFVGRAMLRKEFLQVQDRVMTVYTYSLYVFLIFVVENFSCFFSTGL